MSSRDTSRNSMMDMIGDPARVSRPETFRFFEELLKGGSGLRVRVTGRSMAPFLSGGEIVTIRRAEACELSLGDLIFFRNAYGGHVLHRVVRKRRGEDGVLIVQTKGDAVAAIDHPVGYDEVLGRVCSIEKTGPAGGTKHIDMDSAFWRSANYAAALIHLTMANIRSAVSILTHAAKAL